MIDNYVEIVENFASNIQKSAGDYLAYELTKFSLDYKNSN